MNAKKHSQACEACEEHMRDIMALEDMKIKFEKKKEAFREFLIDELYKTFNSFFEDNNILKESIKLNIDETINITALASPMVGEGDERFYSHIIRLYNLPVPHESDRWRLISASLDGGRQELLFKYEVGLR